MRYDFQCDAGHTTERSFSMADKPDDIACPACNRRAASLLNVPKMVFVRDREWQFDKRKNVPNQGWKKGVSDQQQHRHYVEMVQTAKKRQRAMRRDDGRKHDDGWEHLGRVPIEMHESIVEQQGDREFWQKAAQSGELKQVLKKTDCYLGDD